MQATNGITITDIVGHNRIAIPILAEAPKILSILTVTWLPIKKKHCSPSSTNSIPTIMGVNVSVPELIATTYSSNGNSVLCVISLCWYIMLFSSTPSPITNNHATIAATRGLINPVIQ